MAHFSTSFWLVLCIAWHRSSGDVWAAENSTGRVWEVDGITFIGGEYTDWAESFDEEPPLRAVQIYQQDSGNVTEWPAPENIVVTKSKVFNRSLTAEFRMTWNIRSTQNLRAFRTVICTPKCIGPEVPPTQFEMKFSAPFFTNFNVSVVSLFQIPHSKELLPRRSDVYVHQSGVGPPSRVPAMRSQLDNDTLELEWDPPASPNGPIDFYILDVYDALNSTNWQRLKLDGTRAMIDVSGMLNYAHEVWISAVNVDQNSRETFSSSALRLSLPHKRPGKPSAVKVTSRRATWIGFEISPPISEKLPFTPCYEISSLANIRNKHVINAAVVDHLNPFEEVIFNVSTCYITAMLGRHVCGEPFQAEERSNVAAPSPVATLSVSSSATEVILRWSPPSQPNGPIDGYVVFITDSNDFKRETNHTLDSKISSINFAPEAFIKGRTYNLTVAAFNVDSETGKIHIGERRTVTQWSPGSWLTVVIVVAVLVVLGGLGAGTLCLVKSRRSTSAFFEF